MNNCPHKQPMKLFVIYRFGGDKISSYSGYFICPDCGDYLCTAWVDKADVWNEDTEIYSMGEISEQLSVENGTNQTPIKIFKEWIASDLIPLFEGRAPEILAP